jgi:hypothetical protein
MSSSRRWSTWPRTLEPLPSSGDQRAASREQSQGGSVATLRQRSRWEADGRAWWCDPSPSTLLSSMSGRQCAPSRCATPPQPHWTGSSSDIADALRTKLPVCFSGGVFPSSPLPASPLAVCSPGPARTPTRELRRCAAKMFFPEPRNAAPMGDNFVCNGARRLVRKRSKAS